MIKNLFLAAVTLGMLSSINAQNIVNVKDINPTASSFPHDLIISNDKLFFVAQDETNSTTLWMSSGTDATTINLGPFTGTRNSIQELASLNNKIFFPYDDGVNGQEIWVSDGTVAGTVMLKDIYPGVTSSNPHALTVCNGKLIFLANDVDGPLRVYATDGTPGGTTVIKNNFSDNFNGVPTFSVRNNELYFRSDNGLGSGYGMWKTDGTAAGTSLVKGDFVPANSAGSTVVLNNKMYFGASDNVHGNALWATDSTPAGTYLVKDIYPGGNASPQNFTIYHNKIYFAATDATNGRELWVTDGTAAGTQLVKDVLPGADGSLPYASAVYKDTLYFLAEATEELWKTDGTAANTTLVKSNMPATRFAAVWNNKMYFITGNYTDVHESDGTAAGTKLIRVDNTPNDVYHYSQFGSDDYFLEYHNELYLQAAVAGMATGYELFKLTTATLPLHLLSFAGEVQNDNDVITWSTANEINTSSFTVEESNDGITFKAAKLVKAATAHTGVSKYSFLQKSALNSGGYYRLKMADLDAQYTYSPVIKLNRKKNLPLLVHYNATTRSVDVRNNTNTNCYWQIISINGSIIKKGNANKSIATIPMGSFAGGTYIMTYTINNTSTSLRFVVN